MEIANVTCLLSPIYIAGGSLGCTGVGEAAGMKHVRSLRMGCFSGALRGRWLGSSFQSDYGKGGQRLGLASRAQQKTDQDLKVVAPDDWHLHVRDGEGLASVVKLSAANFTRAVIMPNLVPPVTTTALVSIKTCADWSFRFIIFE